MVAESEVIASLLSDFGRGPWARGGRKLSLFRQYEAFPEGQQFWRRIAGGDPHPKKKARSSKCAPGPISSDCRFVAKPTTRWISE
jgi:hypothetical protein